MRSARIRRSFAATAVAAALLLSGCGLGGGDDRKEPAAAVKEKSSSSETPEASPSKSKKPAEKIVFKAGDESDEVRELQARLSQVKFFAAQPTGFYGDVTTGAVAAYQEKQKGLKVSGTVYASTWTMLKSQTKAPTQDELFPKEQIMGYGDETDQVRELQARLKQLDHFSENPTGYYGNATTASVKAYQQAAGIEATGTVYEDTWEKLKAATKTPTEDELRVPVELPKAETANPSNLDKRCLTGRVLCISKTTNKLSWVIDGKVNKTLDVRFGAEGYETREGTFSVYWKSRDHHSTLYDSPMPFAMFFDGGQAIHFSENFRQNGYEGGSYGCVNVRDRAGIEWLFDEVNEGDKVVIYW